MENETQYYSQKIKEELSLRQRKNSSYSLRAFSKFLEMPVSTLSLVLSGKKKVPKKSLDLIISKLGLTPSEELLFRESVKDKNLLIDEIKVSNEYLNRKVLDDSHFKIIAEWEHYAALVVMELDDYIPSVEYIAQKIGISKNRVEVVMRNLAAAEFVKLTEAGSFELTTGPLKTTEDITSRALQLSHKEALDMGKTKLEEVAIDLRDFSSMCMAVDSEKIPEAKILIKEFRQKMSALLESGKKDEVYQLAVQLYPLSK